MEDGGKSFIGKKATGTLKWKFIFIHYLEIAKCWEETCIKYHIALFLVGLAFDGIWEERNNAIL